MQNSSAPDKRRKARRLGSGEAIREAAATLFLEKGYLATSMDDIAAAARVSKQTIYTHFGSKEQLFWDLVMANAARVEEFVSAIGPTLKEATTLEAGLRRLARAYIGFVARPEVLRLRRLTIGEASRFPDLAREYYERVPGRVYAALASAFEDAMKIEEPMEAAHHFAWLTLGMPLDRGMFFPIDAAPDPEELDRLADSAVRVFMEAYAAHDD